jgi:hypothetical protein
MARELHDEVLTGFLAVGVERARDALITSAARLKSADVPGRRAAEGRQDFGCLIGDEPAQASSFFVVHRSMRFSFGKDGYHGCRYAERAMSERCFSNGGLI